MLNKNELFKKSFHHFKKQFLETHETLQLKEKKTSIKKTSKVTQKENLICRNILHVKC